MQMTARTLLMAALLAASGRPGEYGTLGMERMLRTGVGGRTPRTGDREGLLSEILVLSIVQQL